MAPMTWRIHAAMTALAYLAGAVPFAYLVARMRGVDIRTVGSGNVGATNVFRAVGKGWGILTFVLDAAKGLIPALVFPALAARWTGQPAHPALGLAYGAAAIAGHNWPVFLGFKGGKGVPTSAGVLLGAAPAAVGIGLALWIVVFVAGRYVSVASIAAAAAVAGAGWWLYAGEGPWRPAALSVLGVLAIVRHRSNLRRLAAGTEHRFSFGRRGSPPPRGAGAPPGDGGTGA